MWLKEDKFTVQLGGNKYINTPVIISFRGEPLFTLYRNQGGDLGIDFEIYNASRQKIAAVKKNNIYPHKDHKPSLSLDGTDDSLRLIDKDTGKVIAEIKKRQAATEELDVSVTTFLPDGVLLIADPNGTNLGGTQISGCAFEGMNAAIAIE
jgi:hypothetical protein